MSRMAELRRSRILLLLACAALSGCFGGRSLDCADPARYGYSGSTPPLRVPEGLDVPDEGASLQIPSGEPFVVHEPESEADCLETPPDFFEE